MSKSEIELDDGKNIIFPKMPDTITFQADEVKIGSDNLCLSFEELPWDMTKIKKLEFRNMKGDTVFIYLKKE